MYSSRMVEEDELEEWGVRWKLFLNNNLDKRD